MKLILSSLSWIITLVNLILAWTFACLVMLPIIVIGGLLEGCLDKSHGMPIDFCNNESKRH